MSESHLTVLSYLSVLSHMFVLPHLSIVSRLPSLTHLSSLQAFSWASHGSITRVKRFHSLLQMYARTAKTSPAL